jgi:hypothetical protein
MSNYRGTNLFNTSNHAHQRLHLTGILQSQVLLLHYHKSRIKKHKAKKQTLNKERHGGAKLDLEDEEQQSLAEGWLGLL